MNFNLTVSNYVVTAHSTWFLNGSYLICCGEGVIIANIFCWIIMPDNEQYISCILTLPILCCCAVAFTFMLYSHFRTQYIVVTNHSFKAVSVYDRSGGY